MMFDKTCIRSRWAYGMTGLIAVLIQAQITFSRDATSLGLTLNLADLVMPVLGGFVLLALLRGREVWPKWVIPNMDLMLAGITLLFSLSLVWGMINTGFLTKWAMTNRTVGWATLLAYMYGGAFLVTNYGVTIREHFLRIFCVLMTIVTIANIIAIVAFDMGFHVRALEWIMLYPLDGLLSNRNAFGLLYMAMLAAVTVYHFAGSTALPRWLFPVLYATLPIVTYLNGARVLFIALPFVMALFVYLYRRAFLRAVWIPMLAGSILTVAATQTAHTSFFREHQVTRMEQIIQQSAAPDAVYAHASDSTRAIVYTEALQLWDAHPVFGVGLGSYLEIQKHTHGKLIDLIDSVPLWILCEMGIIGVMVFGYFALRIAYTFTQMARNNTCPQQTFYITILLVMGIFAVMSLFHQLFYVRFIWFLLGLAAAQPNVSSDLHKGA